MVIAKKAMNTLKTALEAMSHSELNIQLIQSKLTVEFNRRIESTKSQQENYSRADKTF